MAEISRQKVKVVGFWTRVFSRDALAGDVRSAVIATVLGSPIGAAVGIATSLLVTTTPLEYLVDVNPDGYGQPKGLFDTAQQQDRKLELRFEPSNLRSAYVCEYKRVLGSNWRNMVLEYFDFYRECFDVSKKGENSFVIFANNRSKRMIQKDGSFLCKCGGTAAQ
jgi:hypothetical protein